MSRISIQQFRNILTNHSDAGDNVRAYRELARRPELAAGVRFGDWPVWSDSGTGGR
ncbi:MAG TPA: hypothetical protein VFS20_31345 [Longimicrobium sp.]|nr:hypothetical protein [Longimicrobium sp.]